MISQNNSLISASNPFISKRKPLELWLRSELSVIFYLKRTESSTSKATSQLELRSSSNSRPQVSLISVSILVFKDGLVVSVKSLRHHSRVSEKVGLIFMSHLKRLTNQVSSRSSSPWSTS